VLLAGGAASLAGGIVQSSEGGYFTTPSASFRSSSAVLLTDEIDVGTGRPADPEPDLGDLGRVRVHVVAPNPAADLFVGIGRRDAARSYLAGAAYDEFTGATLDPFHASFRRVPGTDDIAPPVPQPSWVAQTSGASDVTLEWDKAAGPWSLVVANAAGSPGLDVRADLGFRFGFLVPLGSGLLVLGTLLLGAALVWRTRRPGRLVPQPTAART